MKKIYFVPAIGFLVVFLVASFAKKPSELKSTFEKVVFVELRFDQDSMLFKPFSKAWDQNWAISPGLQLNGISIMNYEKYKFAFDGRKDNLWTILHPMILDGSIPVFYSFDPENFVLLDDGELRYPITKGKETFVTSEKIRENMLYELGQFGPEIDFPLMTIYGEDSIDISGNFVYPPRDFYWYTDRSIVKYKLRISVIYNQKGKELKRIIKSISPVVSVIDDYGQILGEKEMIWMNFDDIKPVLKKAYFFNTNSKPISYMNYIEEKVKLTKIN
jgi:hypothetical protein